MRTRGILERRRVLVDTSAYFALTYSRETTSIAARAIAGRLHAERWHVFTTNFVVAETHALLVTRLNRDVAATFLAELDRGPTTIVRASAEDERQARAIIAQYQDKDFSLTDAISFAVMERLGISYAFTFDHHFAQYGAVVLEPD